MVVSWIDALGFAASGLTLATFAQRSMRPMRLLAIGANLCFIGYGALGAHLPVLLLHVVLLPLNLARLANLRPRWTAERLDADPRVHAAGTSSGLV